MLLACSPVFRRLIAQTRGTETDTDIWCQNDGAARQFSHYRFAPLSPASLIRLFVCVVPPAMVTARPGQRPAAPSAASEQNMLALTASAAAVVASNAKTASGVQVRGKDKRFMARDAARAAGAGEFVMPYEARARCRRHAPLQFVFTATPPPLRRQCRIRVYTSTVMYQVMHAYRLRSLRVPPMRRQRQEAGGDKERTVARRAHPRLLRYRCFTRYAWQRVRTYDAAGAALHTTAPRCRRARARQQAAAESPPGTVLRTMPFAARRREPRHTLKGALRSRLPLAYVPRASSVRVGR